jgi:hypothetical protein
VVTGAGRPRIACTGSWNKSSGTHADLRRHESRARATWPTMTENSGPLPPQRLACDECGAHNTEDFAPGETCPLCGDGHLFPIAPRWRRPVCPDGAGTPD